MSTLRGRTLFITGSSRGIGKAIALRAARDGANIAVIGKTAEPHPKLPGTVYTAADEINAAGGTALPIILDIRNESKVAEAVTRTVEHFGGLDILVNNASAIMLTNTPSTPMKRFDLMHQVNARGTFVCSQACLPHLKKSEHAHILNISPPLNLTPRWFSPHVAYTMAKYGMSMCVLGMAEEFRPYGISVNALWPRTAIATAAVRNLVGGQQAIDRCRTPEIMADAAMAILSRGAGESSGNFHIDDDVLAAAGILDFDQYAVTPGTELLPDFFL